MQQARLSCKMSQKDVAQRMNVKTNLIVDYESGKLAPSNSFLWSNRLSIFFSI